MKNLFKYSIGVMFAGLMVTACSPDSFDGADELGVPTISGNDFDMTVDQTTNQVQVSFAGVKGTYPIWNFNGTTYSTLNSVGYQNNKKGTYYVELKLGNRNGFSKGSIRKEFTFNETKAEYTTELNRLSGKKWRIDHAEPAHLACGPYGGDGAGWWSASPEEKKGTGMYDDYITFTASGNSGGTFTYDPGEDGLTYININSTIFDNGGATEDFDTPTQVQTSTFELKKDDWTDLDGNVTETTYMLLGDNTLFPYISADLQYYKPRFRVETITSSKLVLIYENQPEKISWRFIFTSKEPGSDGGDENAMDWDYNSSRNMWKAVDEGSAFDTFGYYFATGDDWHSIDYKEVEKDGNAYTLTLPAENGSNQWQAQFHIDSKLTASAEKTYNFYMVMETTNDCPGVTFKLTDSGDSNYFIEERVDVPAGGFVFKRKGVTLKDGIDASAIRLFFDFGGSPGGTSVKISNIYFEESIDLNYDDADNLWKAVDEGSAFDTFGYYFAAGNDWHGIDYKEVEKDGNAYILTLPAENGSNQWQAQFHIDTKLTASADKAYNFQFDIESDNDLPQVTMKLTDSGDSNWFTEERNDVEGGGVRRFTWLGVKTHDGADASAIRLFFDFGGSPGGSKVKISNIVFKEAQ